MVPSTKSQKVPTNFFSADFILLGHTIFVPLIFYSNGSHNFSSAHFCSALTFLHLNWGVPTIQNSKVPTNFYSAGSHNFCSTHFCSALTSLHLNSGVPTTQSPKVPTNFYSADFCSTGSHNFCFADFCSTLTFLHLNWESAPFKVQRSQPIFILLIFILLGHTIFVPVIFVLL